MNLYVLIGAVVLALAVTTGVGVKSYETGHLNGHNEVQVEWDKDKAAQVLARAAALKAAQDDVDAVRTKLEAASAELEKAKNEKQIVYRTIVKHTDTLVDRPVYSNVCLDADGLRDINAALAGSAASPEAPGNTSKPDAAVPAPVAVDGAGR